MSPAPSPPDRCSGRLLVLQHIACEPPGAYEDVVREWGAEMTRIEGDEGEQLPDWRGFDGIIAMRSTSRWRASGGAVPAYAQSLESMMGEGALPRLLEEIAVHERAMTQLARSLFAAWLEHSVGRPRPRSG